ncbi:MAG: hypothetical protein ACKVS9_01280 [Phycisphaerae bacterium]
MSAPQHPEPNSSIQFDRADYGAAPPGAAGLACSRCSRSIREAYFSVNGQIACSPCRQAIEAEFRGGSGFGRFIRATLFGVGAGLLGALLYFAVAAISGYELGLMALAVGVAVGYAVRAGSRARGGWLYQLLAIVLAYLSIGMSYSMMLVQELITNPELLSELTEPNESANSENADSQPASSATSEPAASAPASSAIVDAPPDALTVLAAIALIGFAICATVAASPILIGFNSPFAFIILAITVYEAWRINRTPGLLIEGPLALGTAPTALPPIPPPQEPKNG